MKNSVLILVLGLLSLNLQAQFDFGIKAGINTYQIDETISFVSTNSPQSEFSYAVKNTNIGYHFGLYGQFNLGAFIIQPEILFNSDDIDFVLKSEDDPANFDRVINQSYKNLDVPLLVKFKIGPARIMAGPVGHFYIDNKIDFVEGIINEPIENQFRLGYQMGLGIAFWKLHVDLKYEGNFSTFGEDITIYGTELAFSKNAQRLILSAGYEF